MLPAVLTLCSISGGGQSGAVLPAAGSCALPPGGNFSRFALSSFFVPKTGIPLLAWPKDRGDSYTLTEPTSGRDFTAPLEFVSNSPADPNASDIWCFAQLVEMCNNALAKAHAALAAAVPEYREAPPVAIAFDPVAGLFTHRVPSQYIEGKIGVYTRYAVARLFANVGGNNPLVAKYPSPLKEFQIKWTPDYGSAASLLTQEFPSLYAWTDLQEVLLEIDGQEPLTLSDFAPGGLSGARAPMALAAGGAPLWRPLQNAGGARSLHANVAYVFGGARRQLLLNAGDTFRVVLMLA